MKISVKEKGRRRITILLPSILIFNPLVAACAAGIINTRLRENGILDRDITPQQLRRLCRIIMRYKRKHPDWNLVEVKSQEGDEVVIRL
ncbi:MAG: hypothetical protein GX057_03670 [Clostridiales bacterium]|nr:hypothetical protein [Clostridiales bacterium]HOA85115.1 hypothetical protein [Bacillota bacterium]